MESELFGYEKGAFTGALNRKPGKFESAQGGTVFLDEVGELPLASQPKLLRVLQEHSFERLGGGPSVTADFRVVAATNRNLEEEVAAGRFRRDLYFRLNVVPIALPSLRDRRPDIILLAEHFLEHYSQKHGFRVTGLHRGSNPQAATVHLSRKRARAGAHHRKGCSAGRRPRDYSRPGPDRGLGQDERTRKAS